MAGACARAGARPAAVEDLKYGLGSLGAAPLSKSELDQLGQLAGSSESVDIKLLCNKMLPL